MFRRERSAMLGVATPQGAQVDLTLERAEDGTFSVIDAAVGEDGSVRAAVPRPELAGIVDALTPAFAEQGLRIEIGGDGEDEDLEAGGAPPAPGSRGHRSHNYPPGLIEDEPALDEDKLDPESEAREDDDYPYEDERPDLGRPGSRRNPDGTPKTPQEQYEQIDRAQRRNRDAIRSKEKSEQNYDHYLRQLKRR